LGVILIDAACCDERTSWSGDCFLFKWQAVETLFDQQSNQSIGVENELITTRRVRTRWCSTITNNQQQQQQQQPTTNNSFRCGRLVVALVLVLVIDIEGQAKCVKDSGWHIPRSSSVADDGEQALGLLVST
jgi:hypothetical protein